MVQVMDLIAFGEQVRHGLRRRLVRNGRADDVGHVAPISLSWDFEMRV